MTVSAPSRPRRSTVNVETIPAPLKAHKQWAAFRYRFRDGTWTKVPEQPSGKNARTNDPSTWSTFDDALATYEADPTLDGIGYIFAEDDPYCGVDIDKIKNDPERLDWALGIVKRFGTYTEWSVSGNGLHLIGEGRMPDVGSAPQKGRNDTDKGLEAYSRRRFFTFTGKVVEGATTAVVDCQAALDWLLENEFKPVGTGRAEVKLERSAAATPIGDRDQRVRERMYASQRGSEIRMLADGGSVKSKPDGGPNTSSDDLSYANALAFWFDKNPARMAAEMERSARTRPKWYEVHSAAGETYLEMTIATAVSNCSQSFRDLRGHDAGDDPPSIGRIQFSVPDQPVTDDQAEGSIPGDPTTLEEAMVEIQRLRRGLLDRDDRIEMMTGIIADQQAVIAATRAERDQLKELRAIDRRVSLAEQRLDRVSKFSAGQKAAIKAVAKIAPALANSLQKDDPIITRNMIAEVTGATVDTTGAHLKVFDLEGSPVPRELKPYGPKDLTHYKLKTRDPAGIIETMAALGEQLEKRPTARKTRRCKTCPEGTGTIVNIVCEGCGCLLEERRVAAPKADAADNVGKNPTLDPSSAPVDVLVTYGGEKPDVADGPETAERTSNVVPFTHHTSSEVLPGQDGERRDYDITGRCSACQEHTVKRRRSGVWTCAKCEAVLLVEPWAEAPKLVPPSCTRSGCREPAANGFVCAGHLRGDPLPAAVAGAEE
jgi:hypothetical protein